MGIPVFDADSVRARLPMEDCIELMSQVQAAISRGEISLPLRRSVQLPDSHNHLLIMPGGLTEPAIFGAKLLSLFPDNPRYGKPTIQGYVILFDGQDGQPLAMIEAASLTAIRTAAASAAATRVLANPNATTLALLGYGVQATTHFEAMCAVRPIEKVLVWGPDLNRAQRFASRNSELSAIPITAVQTPAAATRPADIVCAVSAANSPILSHDSVSPGCHINLVGAHTPTTREADGHTLQAARVYTEITEFALEEAGDILLAIEEGLFSADQIVAEIGAVIEGAASGRNTSGRTRADQVTLYKNLGNTAQDLAAAHYVFSQSASI